jgi:hypothetical protein
LWCATNEAEITREELGVFPCHVEEGFPDYFFVACVAHVSD